MLKKSITFITLACLSSTYAYSAIETTNSRATFFLNPLGGNHSVAYAINDLGVVVGRAITANNINNNGFVWSEGAAVTTGTLGGPHSFAYSVNNSGSVVGYSVGLIGDSNPKGAYLWENGKIYDLDRAINGWHFEQANDINEAGEVIGYASNQLAYPNNESRAVIQRGGIISPLAPYSGNHAEALAVNDNGVVVGYSSGTGEGSIATVWQHGVTSSLSSLARRAAKAHDINNAGVIVGESMDEIGYNFAVVWEDGNVIRLTGLTKGDTHAYAINESNQIVGTSHSGPDGSSAVLWQDKAVIDLNELLSVADRDAGWHLVTAWDINESGWIVGEAYNRNSGFSSAFLMTSVTTVPEPSRLLSILAGLAFLGFITTRNSHR